MKLIVGLGNPGDKFARHRHNVGFMAVERIAQAHRFAPWRRRFQGLACEGEIGAERCVLLKPDTYMNESGRSTGEAARFLRIAPPNVIVLHDELDLVPGKIKVKTGGGNAGHNGLKSISAHIGNEYVRVRIGIGHPGSKDLVHYYVLHDLAKSDEAWLGPLLDAIADAAPELVKGDAGRFLGEIARRTGSEPCDPAPKAQKSNGPRLLETPRPAPNVSLATPKSPESALAAKLKGWLKGGAV